MKHPVDFLLLLAASLVIPVCGAQQQLIVYPAKNQGVEQQSKDQAECNAWAKQSTGIDPTAVAQSPPPAQVAQQPPAGPSGQRVKGAARGAAAGAIVGEVANNDADEGAAYGAMAGALAGGRRARQQQATAQQQAQASQEQAKKDAEAAQAEKIATYNRAVGACLEARGYTVK